MVFLGIVFIVIHIFMLGNGVVCSGFVLGCGIMCRVGLWNVGDLVRVCGVCGRARWLGFGGGVRIVGLVVALVIRIIVFSILPSVILYSPISLTPYPYSKSKSSTPPHISPSPPIYLSSPQSSNSKTQSSLPDSS